MARAFVEGRRRRERNEHACKTARLAGSVADPGSNEREVLAEVRERRELAVHVARADREPEAPSAAARLQCSGRPADLPLLVAGCGDDEDAVGRGLVDCVDEDRLRRSWAAEAQVDD